MGVPREQLYEAVWTQPIMKLAERYGVSGVFLAKVCRQLNIPHPPRGYWARLAAGHKEPRPSLPPPQPGDALEWSRDGQPRRMPRPLPQAPAPGGVAAQPTVVARRRGTHLLLVEARGPHEEAVKRVELERGSFLATEYLRPRKHNIVDLYVTKDALPRAVKVAAMLYGALEARGYRVTLAPKDELFVRPVANHRERDVGWTEDRWSPGRSTVVYIGTVAIGLTIFEPSEKRAYRAFGKEKIYFPRGKEPPAGAPGGWVSHDDVPTGRFVLRAYSPYPRTTWQREWREAKPGDLRGKLEEIVTTLEAAAVEIAKLVAEAAKQEEIERQRREAQHRVWLEQERVRREKEAVVRRAQARQKSRDELLAIIDAWALARHADEFFADAESRAGGAPPEERAAVIARIALAREVFGGTDALRLLREWRPSE